MAERMRAVVIHSPGGPEKLMLEYIYTPNPVTEKFYSV